MEVVIVLLAISIIGYVVYQSLPATKFQNAQSLFDSGNLDGAMKIYDSIFAQHPDAPAKLAECKLKQGLNTKTRNEIESVAFFREVVEIKKRLPKGANKANYEVSEAKAVYEIAAINFTKLFTESNADIKIKKLKENLLFIDSATKTGNESSFKGLRKNHLSELADINFLFGTQKEKLNKVVEAIQAYSVAKEFAIQSSNSKVLYSVVARTAICNLKNNARLDSITFDDIDKSSNEYKRDFYFRYANRLLQENKYSDAEKVITTYLNFESPSIDKLKEVLRNQKVGDAIKKVNAINSSLEQLYEKAFPVDEVKTLYDNLDNSINEIKLAIPNLSEKLQQLKPSLVNRLLAYYITEEQYGNAINLIQKFPKFWESTELLKNLGISCYGLVAKGALTEKNYRVVISNWLTTVFSDKVILKSLEDTSWDDEFTFTVSSAIGSNFAQHTQLPDNVNYDEASDSNISIGTTQNELLQQFETLIHQNISDTSLAKSVSDFYDKEKEAIQNIVSIIDKDILFAAPYFAKSFGTNEVVVRELDEDYVTYLNEDSLNAGIPYLKNNADTYVKEYATAKELIDAMVLAIHSKKISDLTDMIAISDTKKRLVKKYSTITASGEELAFNAFSTKIEADSQDETIVAQMICCIKFLPTATKLKYQFAKFVTELCIAKVNSKNLDNYNALIYLMEAITATPDSKRVADNIATLIQFNLGDIAYDRLTSTPTNKLPVSIVTKIQRQGLVFALPDIRSLLGLNSQYGYTTNTISAWHKKVIDLVIEIWELNNPLVKTSCKELRSFKNDLISQLGDEAVATIRAGVNLSSQGLALKQTINLLEIVSN